eukprot:TRINITY_DN4884_c0_g2_i1.p1 TRINITY_DN4884_c0_g2~~TRINITY_DN4884_c0_g2_i1.p1  ORF type:complete len:310 (-),score=86.14 TRINITY_DN4884_c0_g2_i1:50-979(-)
MPPCSVSSHLGSSQGLTPHVLFEKDRLLLTMTAAMLLSTLLFGSAAGVVLQKADVLCGPMQKFPNAETKMYADSQIKEMKVGEKVSFKCLVGFTLDGTTDSADEFDVLCGNAGFYEPKGACLKAPVCGAAPHVLHAKVTGKKPKKADAVAYACSKGHSLDGKPVKAAQTNMYFEIECDKQTEQYSQFEGSCRPYSYMPAKEAYKAYNLLFETLFKNDCAGKIKKAYRDQKAHDSWAEICTNSAPQGGATLAECKGLVEQMKSDFEAELEARKEYYEEYGGEGEGKPPNMDDEAKEFCVKLWDVVEKEGF